MDAGLLGTCAVSRRKTDPFLSAYASDLLLLTIPESIWSEDQAQEQRSESIGRLCSELEALAVDTLPMSRRLNHAAAIEARSKDLFFNGVTPKAQLSSRHRSSDEPTDQMVDTASVDGSCHQQRISHRPHADLQTRRPQSLSLPRVLRHPRESVAENRSPRMTTTTATTATITTTSVILSITLIWTRLTPGRDRLLLSKPQQYHPKSSTSHLSISSQ